MKESKTKKTSALPEKESAKGSPGKKPGEDTIILAKDRGKVNVEKCEPDHPLLKEIKDHFYDEWKREHPGDKLPREYFYHSDVGHCPRGTYYQFYYPEKKKDMAVSTILMFTFGNIFHEVIQNAQKKIGHTTNEGIEFGIWSKIGFLKRGRLDAILKEGTPVLFVIEEIKSKNSYAFETPPDDSEVDQLLSYIHDCKNNLYFKAKGKTIGDHGYILYVDRGGLSDDQLAIYKVHYSEERIKVIEGEFARLHEAIQKKTTPVRPYARDSIKCLYCRFEDWCWRGIPRPEVPKIIPDASLEAPDEEIIESMVDVYFTNTAKIKELETDLELAKKGLKQFAKKTGKTDFHHEKGIIKASVTRGYSIDVAYLWKKHRNIFNLIATPAIGKLKTALKEGMIDGTTLEKAKVPNVETSISLRGIKAKKEG